MGWYPVWKTRPEYGCPSYVDLDMFESDQIQETWAIEGNIGPEVMTWLDGKFYWWFPKLSMERAKSCIIPHN